MVSNQGVSPSVTITHFLLFVLIIILWRFNYTVISGGKMSTKTGRKAALLEVLANTFYQLSLKVLIELKSPTQNRLGPGCAHVCRRLLLGALQVVS